MNVFKLIVFWYPVQVLHNVLNLGLQTLGGGGKGESLYSRKEILS